MKNLPVGQQDFEKLIRKDCIYVDKTEISNDDAFRRRYVLPEPSSPFREEPAPEYKQRWPISNAVTMGMERILKEPVRMTETFTEGQRLESLNAFTLLLQAGYLTINRFDRDEGYYYLQIPNEQV